MEPQFSFFRKPITNVDPYKSITLADVYHLIRSERYLARTGNLRSIEDPKEARIFKAKNFDYATFSGTFSKRSETGLEKHSGYLTFDFDHLEDPASIKKLLLADLCLVTQLLFTSPSGKGLKWIIHADLSQLTHPVYFTAVTNYLKRTYHLTPDASGKDVSRACFLPYDPEAYIHYQHLIKDGEQSV